MALRFFQIPARGCEQTETEVNGFLQSHRVLTVDRRDAGENSFWAICVDYLDSSGRDSTRKSGKGRQNQIDYREVLTPEEFVKFSALRDLRNRSLSCLVGDSTRTSETQIEAAPCW